MKAKERILQDRKRKPDPMQRAAGLQRDIARLHTQVETAVRLHALHNKVFAQAALLSGPSMQRVGLMLQGILGTFRSPLGGVYKFTKSPILV